MIYGIQKCMTEWSFRSGGTYDDPFNDVELTAVFTDPDGTELRVPAFWAGENAWRVRYVSPKVGRHHYRTECSDTGNPDLHGREGDLEINPYEGDNPLFKHGPLRVSENRRYLEHLDGTPFFWLGDTWWMGLCKRLGWPGEFQQLATDRVAKGFSVIQIIAGLYPDMPAFDERGANEAGFPWETDYARINPAYFDMADLRIDYLVRNGLAPCVVGCWGYFLKWMGVEKMKRHWRYLVARWGAYPVTWCLAGEATMPYYLSKTGEDDAAFQKRGWTELATYVRDTDPYRNPITIHPTNKGREQVEDPNVLDFEMLQTGHGDRQALPNNVRTVIECYSAQPRMPVFVSEVCYEGIGSACREEVQRLMFWSALLSGAFGHTYGANGIWQVNRRDKPYGPSPHGMSWGNTPWDEAAGLPGSTQLGLARRLLERYEWWNFKPHPEWVVEPRKSEELPLASFAAGIPGKIAVIYLPNFIWANITVKGLEGGVRCNAYLWNPATAEETALGELTPDTDGNIILRQRTDDGRWRFLFPLYQDWILVLENESE